VAATEKRQLILDLLARNKMGGETDAASRDIKGVGDAADKADHKVDEFGKTSFISGQETERLGKASDKTGRQINKLSGEIELAKKELGSLARAYADTSLEAERIDLAKGIRKGEAEIRKLSKAKSLLEDLLPDPEPAAKGFFSRLATSLESAGGSVATLAGNHVGLTIGIAAGAAAGPVLISAMSSVLSAGAGLGVIGAGIMLAVKSDPEIQKAGKEAGSKFIDGLSVIADDAFKGPVLDAIDQLSKEGDKLTKSWGHAFQTLAPEVGPLVSDLIKGADTISGALVGAAEKSGPALDGLGDSIVLISDGVGNFISLVADGGPEAASNLRLISGAMGDLLTQTGMTLHVLNDLANNAWITGPLLPLLRKHYQDAADDTGTFKTKTADLAGAMDKAKAATDGQREALVDLSNELKAETDPVFGLLNAQQELKNAQDAVAESTKKHGKNSDETKAKLRDLALAAIDLQGRAGGLAGSFDGNLTPAMRTTLKAAGLTEDQINGIAQEFKDAKKAGDTYARTYAATAKLTTIYRTVREENRNYAGNSVTGARASGGPVTRGLPYLVGEDGPEIMIPDAAGRVLSASASRGFASVGAAGMGGGQGYGPGSGSGTWKVQMELIGQQEVVTMFRYLMRTANLIQE
jgi:hypothetical protein